MRTPARKRTPPRDPIGSYLFEMRRYAVYMTLRSEAEARAFQATGEHQELDELFFVRDDERSTRLRLECYQQALREASLDGRYTGGTTLLRFLPDGTTEPWDPQAALTPASGTGEAPAPEAAATPSDSEALPVEQTPPPTSSPRPSRLSRLRVSAGRLFGRLVA